MRTRTIVIGHVGAQEPLASVSALFDGAASKEIDGPCRPAFKQIGAPNQIVAIRDVANHHLRQEVPGPAVDLLHLACVAGRVTAEAASRFRFPATAQGEREIPANRVQGVESEHDIGGRGHTVRDLTSGKYREPWGLTKLGRSLSELPEGNRNVHCET